MFTDGQVPRCVGYIPIYPYPFQGLPSSFRPAKVFHSLSFSFIIFTPNITVDSHSRPSIPIRENVYTYIIITIIIIVFRMDFIITSQTPIYLVYIYIYTYLGIRGENAFGSSVVVVLCSGYNTTLLYYAIYPNAISNSKR